MNAKVLDIDLGQATLKRHIREHFRRLGFTRASDGSLVPPSFDKAGYREMHRHQRNEKLEKNSKFLADKGADLIQFFASGAEVVPAEISPRLALVEANSLESDLFRFASLLWQVPVSEGYGRRMRFLVWDDAIGKVIGIFALGDAVFNLGVRDDLIGWTAEDRKARLVNLMDAYVLGAVPPYNMLLCGKLLASLLRTKEVEIAFRKKYKDSVGIISGERRRPKLVAITTTSALGRSSVYNRVKLRGIQILSPIGYTKGWGHFHVPTALFDEMRAYLERKEDSYAATFEFGQGPNWRLRTIRRVFSDLGLGANMAQHGLAREVFICTLADNALEILRGDAKRPIYRDLETVADVAGHALARWVIPRAGRDLRYLDWTRNDLASLLAPSQGVGDTVEQRKNVLRAT